MFKTMKKLVEMNKTVLNSEAERDEENSVLVKITVLDDSNFVSPYSFNAAPVLSEEVSSFLEDSIRPKHYKDSLHIKIYSDCIDENEQAEYITALRNTYKKKFTNEKQHGKRMLISSLIMLLVSLVFLAVLGMLDHFNIGGILFFITDILSWVFLWEAADIFFLERTSGRMQKIKYSGLYFSKITFCNLNERA